MHRLALPGLAAVVLAAAAGPAPAFDPFADRTQVTRLNARIGGQVLDFTRNHGTDRRLYSHALGETRDLYVYLPPGYDGRTPFPAALWLHGIGYDEKSFLDIVEVFDRCIRARQMPPLIIAAPDGSIRGRPALFNGGSFYVNSHAGRFGDYVACDVWGFVKRTFVVRPERDAHVLAGASMGGFGAFNLGIKNRTEFGQLVGVFPPLDLRYVDCHGVFRSDFDPTCVGARVHIRRQEVLARFYGVITIRSQRLLDPLVGRRTPEAETIRFMANESPREMLATHGVGPGEFGMFVGYGTKDQFNIDAMCEHFLDTAGRRGIRPEVVVVPGGKHDAATATAMLPELCRWLTCRVGQYAPPGYDPNAPRPACGRPLCAVPAGRGPFPTR